MRNVTRSIFASCFWLVAVPAAAGEGPKLPVRKVACGETITESVRIANSLFDCPADGLVVGAPGIVIDLGGHRLDGAGVEEGVDNTAGHANVTIRNGILSGFGYGVWIKDAAGNVLTGLRVIGNNDGIELSGATGTEVRGNAVRGNGLGIYMDDASNDNVIAANDASGNEFIGIYLEQSTRNLFLGNTANANGTIGIDADANASGNLFRGNEANGNARSGFRSNDSSNDNAYRGNRAFGNQEHGFEIAGAGHVLQKNTASENGGHGIVSATGAVTLRSNVATRNGFANGAADGVGLGISVPSGAESAGNKASGNDDASECQAPDLECYVELM
jgi:parallel beta-helix repeat protein